MYACASIAGVVICVALVAKETGFLFLIHKLHKSKSSAGKVPGVQSRFTQLFKWIFSKNVPLNPLKRFKKGKNVFF